MDSLVRNLDLLAYLSLMVLQSMSKRVLFWALVGLSAWMEKSLGGWRVIRSMFWLGRWKLFYLESQCSVFIFGHLVIITFDR